MSVLEMGRAAFESLREDLRRGVEASATGLFPLEAALSQAQAKREGFASLATALGVSSGSQEDAIELLMLLDSTSVGTAIAVKRVAQGGADSSGITSALVDLWGQAEAARCLWYDHFVRFPSDSGTGREPSLVETARLLGPQAVAIAARLHEPLSQYIEFVSKVAC